MQFWEVHALVPGDFLICDNASVHWAQDSWDALDELLGAAHIKMRFLPTYTVSSKKTPPPLKKRIFLENTEATMKRNL